jgi:GMP synthase (glutamine-hydrolysing)
VKSVGVLGDSRSYAPVLAIEALDHERATALTNRITGMNRVVAVVQTRAPLAQMRIRACALTPQRIATLRRADAIVRRISLETGYDDSVWQFPVILIPLGTADAPESVVLRPVHSVDGMTAQSVAMDSGLLARMCSALLTINEVAGVFYDLTHKPPGTIEWE